MSVICQPRLEMARPRAHPGVQARTRFLTGSRGTALSLLLVAVGTSGMFPANFISAEEKIDVNIAPLETLVKIIHIGEARALELISLRPFSSLDDLARIKGIGSSRIEDIKKQGLAWVTAEEPVKMEPQQTPGEIIFSEILPSPEGPDEENEWIEFYNENFFGVNLSGWQVKDEKGKTRTYTFPKESFIRGNQYLILPRTVSGIVLNNEGDKLSLLLPNGQISDSVSYKKAERGKSFNLTEEGWLWSKDLTPGGANQIVTEEEIEVPLREKVTAEVGKESLSLEEIPQGKNFTAGLIALLLASFSGIMILAIKKKANSN